MRAVYDAAPAVPNPYCSPVSEFESNQVRNSTDPNLLNQLGVAGCRVVLDSIPDVRFFVKNPAGVYLFASRPMYLAHGFLKPDDLIGHADHEFIPEYLADHYTADDRKVFNGENVLGRVELVTKHRGCPDWYVTSKTKLLDNQGRVLGLLGISRELGQDVKLPHSQDEFSAVIEVIMEGYGDSLELDMLARISGMSLRTFQRHFKKLFRMTPMEYIRQFRVGKACQLLAETNATITTIAGECGFCDHSHLIREFHRFIGTSPSGYRRRYE